MRILFIDSNHPVLHETLLAAGFQCDLYWDKSTEELKSLLPFYDALVIRSRFKIDNNIIDSCPKLKCIGRVGAGMENIDVAYAKSKNISCVCVPEGNADAVGEHAIGMLLMLLNNLKKADLEVRGGKWIREGNRGRELGSMSVGIIGYGYMGAAFARKLTGFDCEILAHDKYKKGFGTDRIIESSLENIFEKADVISLHLPQSVETHYYFNAAFINKFKKPFYVINTARGLCLNTSDLVAALKFTKVQGACLDVLEYERSSFEGLSTEEMPEPLTFLMTSEKVILSPHIAGWTHESNYKMGKGLAEKMLKILSKNSA